MNKILTLIVGMMLFLTLAFTQAQPAFASDGSWTKNEFNSLCTVKLDALYGQLCAGDDSTSGATQTQAENICNCGGFKIADWTNNGHSFKNIQYDAATVHTNVILTYRKWDSTSPWRVFNKLWCDSATTGCVTTAPIN